MKKASKKEAFFEQDWIQDCEAGCRNSTQRRTRSASAVRLNLPAESRKTMTNLRPATLACITKH